MEFLPRIIGQYHWLLLGDIQEVEQHFWGGHWPSNKIEIYS